MTVILKLRFRSAKVEVRQPNCLNTQSAYNSFLATQPAERHQHFTFINAYRVCTPKLYTPENYGFTR